jgi:hypothetical protein
LDVGRTLTRFNFPQADVFNPLGVLLARHLTQLDEARRNAAGREDNGLHDDQPQTEVADTILATSTTALTRGMSRPESESDSKQALEDGGGVGDGIVARNFPPTDPILLPGDIPIDLIRVRFTAGSMRATTEGTVNIAFLDKGSSGGARDDQSSATVAEDRAEDRAEVGTPTSPEIQLFTHSGVADIVLD